MKNSNAYKFAPVVTDEKKVDVALQDGEAVIKLSQWVDGLGWCGEKTMQIDAEMLDELHRVISAARVRLKQQAADEGQEIIPAKVLEFPKFA